MSQLLSSIVGSGSAGGMVMPALTALTTALTIKNGAGSIRESDTSGFYMPIEADQSSGFFETATLQPVSNQLEQTIVDTGTGHTGVLTQVVAARTSGTMTVRIYIDGIVHAFVGENPSAAYVTCVGDFAPWLAQNAAGTPVGFGGVASTGWHTTNSTRQHTMLSPEESAAKGLPVGMVFRDSLKVTIQSTGIDVTVGSASHKAVAAWLNYIPKGL